MRAFYFFVFLFVLVPFNLLQASQDNPSAIGYNRLLFDVETKFKQSFEDKSLIFENLYDANKNWSAALEDVQSFIQANASKQNKNKLLEILNIFNDINLKLINLNTETYNKVRRFIDEQKYIFDAKRFRSLTDAQKQTFKQAISQSHLFADFKKSLEDIKELRKKMSSIPEQLVKLRVKSNSDRRIKDLFILVEAYFNVLLDEAFYEIESLISVT